MDKYVYPRSSQPSVLMFVQAHYLRTHFPEVDVPAGVIRNQTTEDTLQATELRKFDPFEGNILDIVVDYDKTTHLVFPMGELSTELSMLMCLLRSLKSLTGS